MKYLVLKKRLRREENLFLEAVGTRSMDDVDDFHLPAATTIDVSDHEARDLRRDPSIEAVIPSMPFRLIHPVDDPSPQPPAPANWALDAIRATTSSCTGAGVTVAVLDTGILPTHPAFAGLSLSPNNLCDFVTRDEGVPGSATDGHGHGTHVAATIFGRPVNGERIGVAPGITRVLIGKVLGDKGGGSTQGIYNAIGWAIARRADIISMSLGFDFPGMTKRLLDDGLPPDIAASRALEAYRANLRLFDTLAQSVQAALPMGRGALLIAASGNESRRHENPKFTVAVSPPAVADGFLSVGAVGPSGNPDSPFTIASFSNTGCLLSAPGVAIRSAALDGGLTAKSGTSMATPHVAGAAALWLQKLFPSGNRPSGWARDVQRSLESSAKPTALTRDDAGLGVVQCPA